MAAEAEYSKLTIINVRRYFRQFGSRRRTVTPLTIEALYEYLLEKLSLYLPRLMRWLSSSRVMTSSMRRALVTKS
ncbi:hypothetical protein N7495_006558 [Penicillium taxi]|uniref:uncharacterized protein n=1 Tax=Penicillium taxi TaxID=168475 RepID=UPI0025451280|nr:uncharacterized protein N7495_006558 [Penicillium taxi]KAJ5894867.1 hypothetical protein N7495_006558 [Penicillium taxi]